MYYDKFLPFYLTYASPALYSGERMQEREFALMKSYFPDTDSCHRCHMYASDTPLAASEVIIAPFCFQIHVLLHSAYR